MYEAIRSSAMVTGGSPLDTTGAPHDGTIFVVYVSVVWSARRGSLHTTGAPHDGTVFVVFVSVVWSARRGSRTRPCAGPQARVSTHQCLVIRIGQVFWPARSGRRRREPASPDSVRAALTNLKQYHVCGLLISPQISSYGAPLSRQGGITEC